MATPLKNVKDVLEFYGQRIVALMAKALASTQHLKNEIDYEVKEEDNGDLNLRINIPEYGKFVDEGRRPWGRNVPSDRMWNTRGNKFPPVKPIEDWIKSKGLPQFRIQKEWKSAGNRGGRWISHSSRLFLIRRSIAVRGIKPRPFIHYAYDNLEALFTEIGSAAAVDVAVNLQNTFNEAGIGENNT